MTPDQVQEALDECGDGIWGFPAVSEPPTRQKVYNVITAVLDTETPDADAELVIDALTGAGLLTLSETGAGARNVQDIDPLVHDLSGCDCPDCRAGAS